MKSNWNRKSFPLNLFLQLFFIFFQLSLRMQSKIEKIQILTTKLTNLLHSFNDIALEQLCHD